LYAHVLDNTFDDVHLCNFVRNVSMYAYVNELWFTLLKRIWHLTLTMTLARLYMLSFKDEALF